MGVVSAEKLFIDPKEEITFIVEKIKSLDNKKVILVVPQNSHLLSSNVSVNILFRQLLEEDKLVAIVTEDEYGKTISQRAGFVTVEKVSEIGGDVWMQALKNKESLKEHLADRKKNLLAGISGEQETIKNAVPDGRQEELRDREQRTENREQEIRNPKDQTELIAQDSKQESDDGEITDYAVSEGRQELRGEKQDLELETQNSQLEGGNEEPNSDLDAEEQALGKYKKPRQEPKVVEIEGLKILAGGDVNHFNKTAKNAIIEDELILDDMKSPTETFTGREVKKNIASTSFTGKDLTKVIKPKKQFGWFGLFNRRKDLTQVGIGEPNPAKSRRKKIILAGLLASILMVGVGGYFFVFKLSSVDVEITFKKQELDFNRKVIAVEDGPTDLETSSISAKFFQEENLSISRTGKADGKGKRGEKAKGFVTIYNTTSAEVKLSAGAKITSVATGLKYSITKEITVPATNLDTTLQEEAAEIGKVEDVSIEATDFGAEYNIEDGDSNTNFEIEGFSGLDDVYAKRFNAFEGGSSQEFTAVSKDNIENLKKQILPDLEKQGKSKIEAFVGSGYILIPGSIKFEETEVTSNPKEGEEAKDSNFNLTVEGKISGFAVKESDLQAIVEKYLEDDEQNLSLELESIGDYVFEDVVRDENRVSFNLSLVGEAKQTVAEEIIFEAIKGKKLKDAKEHIQGLEQVEEVKISFNPGFIPESWKFVPGDNSRVHIVSK